MSWRVLATARHFDVTSEPHAYLRERGCELVPTDYGNWRNDAHLTSQELITLLQGVDATIIAGPRMTREVIAAASSLKVIARRGVGYDSVDVQAATEHGVLVTITPGTIDDAVADHVFALMLAIGKRILDGHRCLVDGRWEAQVGVELWRKTLGIIGFGRIGRAVARRAAGFEMRVLAYDVVQDKQAARALGATYVSLDELMRQADFVSVNAPLSASTFHLIGARQLALMKPEAILINTARGPLVDEAALIRVLQEGRIGGAGLDVFEQEPPTPTPLTDLKNVVLTPHGGGYTKEGLARANLMAAEMVVSLMQGVLPEEGVVNPAAWEAAQARQGHWTPATSEGMGS